MEERKEALAIFMLIIMAIIFDFSLFMSMIISLTIISLSIRNYNPKAFDMNYAYDIIFMILMFMLMTISFNNLFNSFI